MDGVEDFLPVCNEKVVVEEQLLVCGECLECGRLTPTQKVKRQDVGGSLPVWSWLEWKWAEVESCLPSLE